MIKDLPRNRIPKNLVLAKSEIDLWPQELREFRGNPQGPEVGEEADNAARTPPTPLRTYTVQMSHLNIEEQNRVSNMYNYIKEEEPTKKEELD
jgi:hypothetical protein